MKSTISSLVIRGYSGTSVLRPTIDPLLVENSLQEATLVSAIHAFVLSTVAILFDLRTSLYFDDGNTGILIVRNMLNMATSSEQKRVPYVWVMSGSETQVRGKTLRVRLSEVRGGSISIEGHTAEFIVGNVEDIGGVAAAIEDNHISDYLRTVPNWESQIEVTGITIRSMESTG